MQRLRVFQSRLRFMFVFGFAFTVAHTKVFEHLPIMENFYVHIVRIT